MRRALGGRSLEAALGRLLPAVATAVAVLVAPGDEATASMVARLRPEARIVSLDARSSVLQRHGDLTAGAPWDAIVDAGPSRHRLRRVLASYYHLRMGGVLVMPDVPWWAPVARIAAGREGFTPVRKPETSDDVDRLRASLAGSGREGRHAYLVRGGKPAWAKLDEASANRMLALRPEIGRVLQLVPGQAFTRASEVRQNDSHRRFADRTEIVAPAVALREYHDVYVAPRQIVLRDQMLLPDTYRHNARRRLTHLRINEVAWLFGRPREDLSSPDRLEGVYYHLDNEARGHFGHLLTEQVSRLWAWAELKREHPDLKAVLLIRKDRELRSWEYELFEAAGIARGDVTFLRRPAQVERLLSAAPLLCNPDYVHPRIVDTWDSVGDNLAARATLADLPGRIFVGRRTDKRACRNGAALEARFADHGFTVVYPEEHPLADQVALFRGAQVIAGYVGSGLFTTCFVKEPTPVIAIGSSRYSPRNEELITAVRGQPLTMITSRPDDKTDLHSSYEFDFSREGRMLDRVLAELD